MIALTVVICYWFRNDVSYKLSKEQEEKLSKKSELQSELAKMDQYLQRLLNREKLATNIDVPIVIRKEEKDEIPVSSPKGLEKTANEVIVQELEEKKDSGSSNIGKKKSKKVKYTPLDLSMIPSSSPPSIHPPIIATKPSIPTSFAQWSTIFATDSASPTSTSIVTEKDSADVETNKIGADMKKISISSSFGGGRTVLSPPVTGTSKGTNIPPSLSSSIMKPSNIASPQSKLTNSSSPAAATTGNSSNGFSLADFLTPKKQQPVPQNSIITAATPLPDGKAKSVWGNKHSTPGSSANVASEKKAVATVQPVTPPSNPKKSLLEIQQEEEYLRQNSATKIPGPNSQPVAWRLDRHLRGETVQEVMAKEMIAKQENEEILREVKAFEEREKKRKEEEAAKGKTHRKQSHQKEKKKIKSEEIETVGRREGFKREDKRTISEV